MFLANENFPYPSVRLLRQKGARVISIQEISSGIDDGEVIKKALELDLTILTFDKD